MFLASTTGRPGEREKIHVDLKITIEEREDQTRERIKKGG